MIAVLHAVSLYLHHSSDCVRDSDLEKHDLRAVHSNKSFRKGICQFDTDASWGTNSNNDKNVFVVHSSTGRLAHCSRTYKLQASKVLTPLSFNVS